MAHWRDRGVDESRPHGTDYWYRRGCRCQLCDEWRRAEYRSSADFYKKQRAASGVDVLVPAAPTVRRLRALARIGWSAQAIADRTGMTEFHISRTRRGINGPDVLASTDRAVRDIYEVLSMTVNDTHHGRKAMSVAKKNGWLAPLDWEDIERGIEG